MLATALRVLTERGLPDLTMRALARELEVQPSALYWHFESKQELLAGIADEILAPVSELPAGTSPAQTASAFREAMLSVTDGAEVVVSTLALGLGADRAYGRVEASLIEAGLVATEAASLATTLVHYCIGHTSHEQQRAQARRFGVELERSPIAADTASFTDGLQRLLGPVLPPSGSASADSSAASSVAPSRAGDATAARSP